MGAGWLGLRDPVTTRGRRELGAHLTAEVVGPAHGGGDEQLELEVPRRAALPSPLRNRLRCPDAGPHLVPT